MIIIIDGYNVLKKIYPSSGSVTEPQRNAFINSVSRYSDTKGHKTYIVFDAGPSRYQTRENKRGTTIIYAGAHSTADDVVTMLAQQYKNRECIVVTEDRELQSRVKEHNACTIPPLIFYEKMKAIQQKSHEYIEHERSTLTKLSEESNPELDLYFQHLSDQGQLKAWGQKIDDFQKDATISKRRTGGSPLSKKEKNQQRKIKKL